MKGVYNAPSLMKFRIVTENRQVMQTFRLGDLMSNICTRDKRESEFSVTLHSHGDRVIDNRSTIFVSRKWPETSCGSPEAPWSSDMDYNA